MPKRSVASQHGAAPSGGAGILPARDKHCSLGLLFAGRMPAPPWRRPSRLQIGFAALLLWPGLPALCNVTTSSATQSARPNIILILSDDQRWDTLKAAGNPNIHTPNLDRLATEGAHFIQGTIATPQCSPARAQLLTGLPPHRNGWYSNQSQRKDVKREDGFDQYPLLPRLLRAAGYQTGLVGKWHLAPDPWSCGFSDIRLWLPGGSSKYKDPDLAHGNSRRTKPSKGFVQEQFTESALRFIGDAGQGPDPFFLWLAYTAPHTPMQPNPERIQALYKGKSMEQLVPPGFVGPDAAGKAEKWNLYYESITLLDEQVGRILNKLDEQKLTSNTVVVFLGDNGYMMGNRNVSGKVVPYEGSVRVPYLIRAPGLAKIRGRHDAPVSSSDIPPTLLHAAGVEPPKAWAGRNLLPLLQGSADHGIRYAVSEFYDTKNWKFGDPGYRLIRTPTHKLIDWITPTRTDEFYDLQADPQEKTNLIEAEAAAETRRAMEKDLADWGRRTEWPENPGTGDDANVVRTSGN